jgi:tetratricopeptide (TPR) repeat protein
VPVLWRDPQKDVPLEELPETLTQIAARHREMLDRLAALNPDDPVVRDKVEEARVAIKAGDYDRADQLLSEAENSDMAAVRLAERLAHQAQQAADQRRLSTAAIRAERGELSLTQLKYLDAAQHFQVAADLLLPSAADLRGDYLDRYASALRNYGYVTGDNAFLLQAIDIYEKALFELPRERVPLLWARIQRNLGVTLNILGARETGTKRFDQAVTTFQTALEVATREQDPLGWALAQAGLGQTLMALDEREPSTERLEQADTIFQTVLEVATRERDPDAWVWIQTNLGQTLRLLGERENSTERLKKAVIAFQAALEIATRERHLPRWAAAQNYLGRLLAG